MKFHENLRRLKGQRLAGNTGDVLTARQARFVDEYLLSGNGAEAARLAGYSAKTARQMATENLSKPAIQAAIQAREDATASQLELTRQAVIGELQGAIALAREQQNPMAMISGWREIAKMCGFYASERVAVELSAASRGRRTRYEEMDDDTLFRIAMGQVVEGLIAPMAA